MSLKKTVISLTPAAFTAFDSFVKATPVPADHAILLKIPAAVVCAGIVWFAKPPKSNRSALAAIMAGAFILAGYIFFTLSSLHSNPQFYRPGDNSVIGFWPTEAARTLMKQGRISEDVLRDQYGPANWTQVYSEPSQLSRCAVMSLLYCIAFGLVTFALKRL